MKSVAFLRTAAAEKNERSALSLLALARSWHMNKDDERAIQALKKLLEEYPEAVAAEEAKNLLRELEQ